MRDDLRDRFFTPFVLPITVIGVMLLIGYSLSRILLAVSAIGAALVALLAAAYVMGIAFFIEARRRIPPRTLGVALAMGLIGLVGAGAVANAAGPREVEHDAEGAAGQEQSAGNPNEPLFVSVDNDYTQAPEALPPGTIEFTLDNEGAVEHNVTIEELGDETILDAAGGATDQATVDLAPGTYTYYCSVPGHRVTMEGTLSIEEGVETGGAGAAGASEPASASSEGAAGAAGASDAPGGASEAGSES